MHTIQIGRIQKFLKTVNSFEAYKIHMALKLHFTSDKYDFIRYNGSTRANPEKFKTHQNKYFYEKLIQKFDWGNVLLANVLNDPTLWIKDIVDDSKKYYINWKKYKDSFEYFLKIDCRKAFENDMKMIKSGELFEKYLKGVVSHDFMIVLDNEMNLFKFFDKKFKDDPIWESEKKRLDKYKTFVYYDRAKVRDTIKSVLNDV